MSTKFSIIIPTYNRIENLKICLDRILNSQYENTEILVIDDGSKDNTKSIIKAKYPMVKYFYQNNQGVSSARNKGLENCNGKYIAFLDSDDLWYPQRLLIFEKVLNFLPDNVGLIFNRIDKIVNNKSTGKFYDDVYFGTSIKKKIDKLTEIIEINFDDEIVQIKYGKLFLGLLAGNIIHASSAIIRREVYKQIGGFRNDLIVAEDSEFFLRVSKHYKIAHIPFILTSLSPPDNIQSLSRKSNDILKIKNTIKYVEEISKNEKNPSIQKKLIKRLSNLNLNLGYHYLTNYKKQYSKKYLFTSITLYRINPKAFLLYFFAFLPDSFLKFLSGIKKNIIK